MLNMTYYDCFTLNWWVHVIKGAAAFHLNTRAAFLPPLVQLVAPGCPLVTKVDFITTRSGSDATGSAGDPPTASKGFLWKTPQLSFHRRVSLFLYLCVCRVVFLKLAGSRYLSQTFWPPSASCTTFTVCFYRKKKLTVSEWETEKLHEIILAWNVITE